MGFAQMFMNVLGICVVPEVGLALIALLSI